MGFRILIIDKKYFYFWTILVQRNELIFVIEPGTERIYRKRVFFEDFFFNLKM